MATGFNGNSFGRWVDKLADQRKTQNFHITKNCYDMCKESNLKPNTPIPFAEDDQYIWYFMRDHLNYNFAVEVIHRQTKTDPLGLTSEYFRFSPENDI